MNVPGIRAALLKAIDGKLEYLCDGVYYPIIGNNPLSAAVVRVGLRACDEHEHCDEGAGCVSLEVIADILRESGALSELR